MTEYENRYGIRGIVEDGLSYISQTISASIFPPITDGVGKVMNDIEYRLMQIEKKVLGKMSSLVIMGFGGVFLVFALLFFLTEVLGWSNAAAYFSIGAVIFMIGLLLKVGEPDR